MKNREASWRFIDAFLTRLLSSRHASTLLRPSLVLRDETRIGVFYPDKKSTQRIGIIPDREVRPTTAGIRAGRDEVLEAAIREIVGKDVPAAQIEKMIKP